MTDINASAWAICERVAEAQALLHDHTEGGQFTASELVRKRDSLGALTDKDADIHRSLNRCR